MTDAAQPSATVPEEAAKILDALPGLIGALDTAIKDIAGKPIGFVLMISLPGGVAHASNIQPAATAMQFVKDFAATIEVGNELSTA